jgi:hypothetical protein
VPEKPSVGGSKRKYEAMAGNVTKHESYHGKRRKTPPIVVNLPNIHGPKPKASFTVIADKIPDSPSLEHNLHPVSRPLPNRPLESDVDDVIKAVMEKRAREAKEAEEAKRVAQEAEEKREREKQEKAEKKRAKAERTEEEKERDRKEKEANKEKRLKKLVGAVVIEAMKSHLKTVGKDAFKAHAQEVWIAFSFHYVLLLILVITGDAKDRGLGEEETYVHRRSSGDSVRGKEEQDNEVCLGIYGSDRAQDQKGETSRSACKEGEGSHLYFSLEAADGGK